MLNPERLIEDLFDDQRLSDAKLRGFSDDALLRMSFPDNNPGGIYSTLITDTTSKYNAFFGKMNNVAIKKAISEGLTVTMEASRTAVVNYISDLNNLVKFKFKNSPATYQEFYPLGMKEYYDADLSQLPTLLARIKAAANTHLLASNPAEVGELIALIDAFTAARTAQQTLFIEVENLSTGRREDRKALTLQLTTNMLTIALNNLGNADNYNNYYNPSYLPLADKVFTTSGIIAAGAILVAVNEGVFTRSSVLTVYNQGLNDLIYSITDQPGVIDPAHQFTVQAGEEKRVQGEIPVFEQYYINVQNPNPIDNGKWKVKVG